jgi:glycosyltransferase involved in cell wall biosynthesis
VIEAMGCGVPVAAMRWGDRHAESIGAMLVGEDAVPRRDAGAYWAKVAGWCGDAAARREAGARQRCRALARWDYGVIVRAYEQELRAAMARWSATEAA